MPLKMSQYICHNVTIYKYIYIYVCMYMYIIYDMYIYVCICMMDTQHQSSLFCWGEQLSVPSFEKGGSEKMTVWGNLKSFCHAEYLLRGACYFSCQKRLSKIKYVFEFTISNVDLGLL